MLLYVKEAFNITLLVNFFAGPGAGKTTVAAGVFAELKLRGIETEFAGEYAKELVWEEREATLENQYYVFGKQLQRINRVYNKVLVTVTDSPIILSAIYKPDYVSNKFDEVIVEEFNRFNTLNYFVKRPEHQLYIRKGRREERKEALEIDKRIINFLNYYGIEYENTTSTRADITGIANAIEAEVVIHGPD